MNTMIGWWYKHSRLALTCSAPSSISGPQSAVPGSVASSPSGNLDPLNQKAWERSSEVCLQQALGCVQFGCILRLEILKWTTVDLSWKEQIVNKVGSVGLRLCWVTILCHSSGKEATDKTWKNGVAVLQVVLGQQRTRLALPEEFSDHLAMSEIWTASSAWWSSLCPLRSSQSPECLSICNSDALEWDFLLFPLEFFVLIIAFVIFKNILTVWLIHA